MELRLPEVKLQYRERIENILVSQLLLDSKFGILAVWPAIIFYYAMLVYDAGFAKQRDFFILQMSLILLVTVYIFLLSHRIQKARRRRLWLFVFLGVATLSIGISFSIQIPAIANPDLKTVAFTFVAAVFCASAFAFTSDKYLYPFFSALLMGPIVYYFLAVNSDILMRIFGAMILILYALFFVLSRVEYGRSLRLILKEVETSENLDVIGRLKSQQDGDYFLTSLLLKPLSVNNTDKQGPVSVEFLTKQYKDFEFRNHNSDIGGDISAAHDITLRGSPCTVMFNADAMGKSMQGAGGALVIGSVFESMVKRTVAQEAYRGMFPERWLKSILIELQKVFESFDGSMLVSAMLGVIEHDTGVLYHLNLEHPSAVLYRNGRARFIEQENYYRKLGTTGVQGTITVATEKLEAGDVVFFGSDGKDDLRLDAEGETVVNEDETLFLRNVEKSGGAMRGLYEAILASGKLMDDISLIRIGYHPQPKVQAASEPQERVETAGRLKEIALKLRTGQTNAAALSLNAVAMQTAQGAGLLRPWLLLAIKCGQYERAAEAAVEYIRLHPMDDHVIHAAALLFARLKKIDLAIDFGERLRLRGKGGRRLSDNLRKLHALKDLA